VQLVLETQDVGTAAGCAGWSGATAAECAQFKTSAANHADPTFGDLPISAPVDVAHKTCFALRLFSNAGNSNRNANGGNTNANTNTAVAAAAAAPEVLFAYEPRRNDHTGRLRYAVGLYTFNPLDPRIESACFQPLRPYSVKKRFQAFALKFNVYLYNAGAAALTLDATGVGASDAGAVLRASDGAAAGVALPPTRLDAPLYADHPKSLAGMTRIAVDARMFDYSSV
jgi:hypothetical protein